MKTRPKQTELRRSGNSHDDRSKTNVAATLIDPATGRPVVRDLRYRELVAHKREFYFLNHNDNQ